MKKKLRSRKGLTLTEMLVTVIIVGLMAAGVAVGVSASLNVYRESTWLSDAQTLSGTLSQAVMDELRYASNVAESSDAPVYDSLNYGEGVVLTTDDEGHLAVAYEDGSVIKLIGSGAYNKLHATVEYPYDEDAFSVTVTIKDASEETEITSAVFSVTPLTP